MSKTMVENSIIIAPAVIAAITNIVVSEIDGIHSLQPGIAKKLASVVSPDKVYEGVEVSIEEKKATIMLTLAVNYGLAIPELTAEVQKKVKSKVEELTGMELASISITIAGLVFEDNQTTE